MYCFKISEDEAQVMWRHVMRGKNLMRIYVPWVIWLCRKGHDNPQQYLFATMHHWDEFITLLTVKKLTGEYDELK
jgi:hypothetical protein